MADTGSGGRVHTSDREAGTDFKLGSVLEVEILCDFTAEDDAGRGRGRTVSGGLELQFAHANLLNGHKDVTELQGQGANVLVFAGNELGQAVRLRRFLTIDEADSQQLRQCRVVHVFSCG